MAVKVRDLEAAGPAQRSKYEEFAAADGVLRLTEFHQLPAPRSFYGKTEIELVRSVDTRTNVASAAVKVAFEDADELSYVSFLDEDELGSIRAGLALLCANRGRLIAGARTYTEVDYRTRAGFRVGMYCTPGGKAGEFMEVGGHSVFLLSLDELLRCVDGSVERLRSLPPIALGR